MIVIHVKPGTHAAMYVRVRYARKPPVVGQVIHTKPEHSRRSDGVKWTQWLVREVRDGPHGALYCLEAW